VEHGSGAHAAGGADLAVCTGGWQEGGNPCSDGSGHSRDRETSCVCAGSPRTPTTPARSITFSPVQRPPRSVMSARPARRVEFRAEPLLLASRGSTVPDRFSTGASDSRRELTGEAGRRRGRHAPARQAQSPVRLTGVAGRRHPPVGQQSSFQPRPIIQTAIALSRTLGRARAQP